MDVLVIGSGGRESAIAWKLAQSSELGKLYCMPGNPGTAAVAENVMCDIKDFGRVAAFVLEKNVDMVVVGPEDPLVGGMRDYFRSRPELSDVMFIGPSADGAALEGSKDFAKDFMHENGIPTARHFTCTASCIEEGLAFLDSVKPPYVLKADGLAAGKGVLIIEDRNEAGRSLEEMLHGKFGSASSKVVIEEYLHGIELSVFVLTDGRSYMILPEAKDYKRIGEGDTGLNTGGMGSVSPVPFVDSAFMKKVEDRIIKPTVEGFGKRKMDYVGFVFIGLMNCGGDPYVIEYNVRMGDPETESVMRRIDSDLLQHLKAAACGSLSGERIRISDRSAVTVVTVSGGYPEGYAKGYEISGLDSVKGDTVVFHAGTSLSDGKVVTSGGRVLAVTSMGDDIVEAAEKAYASVSGISYKDMYYRKDVVKDLLKYL